MIKNTVIGMLALLVSTVSHATLIDVTVNGNDVGQIDSYSGAKTAISNWNKNFDPDIGPQGIDGAAQFFFYFNPLNGLTFNILLDNDNGLTGNFALDATVVSDSDPVALLGDDNFNEFFESTTNGLFIGNWQWVNCCTDGGIIGGLTGDWSITVNVNSFSQNMTDLIFVGPTQDIGTEPGQQMQIVFTPAVPASAPSIAALFALGLAGLSLRQRFKRL